MFGLLSRLAGQLQGSGFIESILGNYFAASPKRPGILVSTDTRNYGTALH